MRGLRIVCSIDSLSKITTLVHMRRRLVLICLLAVFTGCGTTAEADGDEYGRQLAALDHAWDQGREARLRLKALPASQQMCRELYRSTVASELDWGEEGFVDKGEAFYVNGCTGKGRPTVPSSTQPD